MNIQSELIKRLGGVSNTQYYQLESELNTLRIENKALLDKLKLCDQIEESLTLQYKKLYADYEILELKRDKHESLEAFKLWLSQNIKPTPKLYNYDNTTSKPVHTVIKILSPKQTEMYQKYISDLIADMYYNIKTTTPDDAVYQLNKSIDKWIGGKYATDAEAWGRIEKWESPDELYEVLVKKRKGLDCDGVMLFKYYCIRLLFQLRNEWTDQLWRLRCIISDVYAQSGIFKHASLAWVKSTINNWVLLESTYYPELFEYCWGNNISVSDNHLYRIEYSFDENSEYSKFK